jgi:hypothetical protein
MSDEPEYNLVMPFVTCASKGGPHDDTAYVAGWEMGALDIILGLAVGIASEINRTLRVENQAQADLLAMKHGYHAVFEAINDEWVHARFMEQGAPID